MSDHTEEQGSNYNDAAADVFATIALISLTIAIVVYWLSGKVS